MARAFHLICKIPLLLCVECDRNGRLFGVQVAYFWRFWDVPHWIALVKLMNCSKLLENTGTVGLF
jgi:hypothetical protein